MCSETNTDLNTKLLLKGNSYNYRVPSLLGHDRLKCFYNECELMLLFVEAIIRQYREQLFTVAYFKIKKQKQ